MKLPTYDTYSEPERPSNASRLSVKVVDSIEDLLKVFAIRAATYMSEQNCPYREEFDGNDFCSAHLLGFIDAEPAGCLRLRFFSDFVKLERLAVRSEFRTSRLAFHLVRGGIDLARKKGFTVLYGHAPPHLAKFWGRFGFRPLENQPDFVFSDVSYSEMRLDLKDPDPQPITIDSGPYVLIRPEGQWDRPGVLEESSVRGAIMNRRAR